MAANTRLLYTHRQAIIVLERVRVRVDDQRVVYDEAEGAIERTFNIPHANLAFLLLGQGTSITQAAMRQLAEEGVVVGFTGSGGTPLLMASYDVYRPTERLHAWLTIYADPSVCLEAAKQMQRQRVQSLQEETERICQQFDFEAIDSLCKHYLKQIDQANSIDTLRGYEGRFCSRLYAELTKELGINRFKRSHGGEREAESDDTDDNVRRVNRFLDHGNYLAYGLASVVLWAYGIPAGLAVMHGASRAGGLVFDLADTIKDAYILPLACVSARKNHKEQDFRKSVIKALDQRKALERLFHYLDDIIKKYGC